MNLFVLGHVEDIKGCIEDSREVSFVAIASEVKLQDRLIGTFQIEDVNGIGEKNVP